MPGLVEQVDQTSSVGSAASSTARASTKIFEYLAARWELAVSRVIKKVEAPDCAGALALEGYIRLRKQCQYLLPLFGAAMVSAPESDGSAAPPLLAPPRVVDPVVVPFCVFLPELAPGLMVPSLDAPGADWF